MTSNTVWETSIEHNDIDKLSSTSKGNLFLNVSKCLFTSPPKNSIRNLNPFRNPSSLHSSFVVRCWKESLGHIGGKLDRFHNIRFSPNTQSERYHSHNSCEVSTCWKDCRLCQMTLLMLLQALYNFESEYTGLTIWETFQWLHEGLQTEQQRKEQNISPEDVRKEIQEHRQKQLPTQLAVACSKVLSPLVNLFPPLLEIVDKNVLLSLISILLIRHVASLEQQSPEDNLLHKDQKTQETLWDDIQKTLSAMISDMMKRDGELVNGLEMQALLGRLEQEARRRLAEWCNPNLILSARPNRSNRENVYDYGTALVKRHSLGRSVSWPPEKIPSQTAVASNLTLLKKLLELADEILKENPNWVKMQDKNCSKFFCKCGIAASDCRTTCDKPDYNKLMDQWMKEFLQEVLFTRNYPPFLKGMGLVFVNSDYPKENNEDRNLPGMVDNGKKMMDLFKQLRLSPVVFFNLSADEVKQVLRSVDMRFFTGNTLAAFFGAHGDSDKICFANRTSLNLSSIQLDLVTPPGPDELLALAIFQACRGNYFDDGSTLKLDKEMEQEKKQKQQQVPKSSHSSTMNLEKESESSIQTNLSKGVGLPATCSNLRERRTTRYYVKKVGKQKLVILFLRKKCQKMRRRIADLEATGEDSKVLNLAMLLASSKRYPSMNSVRRRKHVGYSSTEMIYTENRRESN